MPTSISMANDMLSLMISKGPLYLALLKATPPREGAVSEVTGAGYQRQLISFSAPSGGATDNTAEIRFPQATGNWGTVSAFAVFNAKTGGTMLWGDSLGASYNILTGSFIFINPKGLKLMEGI